MTRQSLIIFGVVAPIFFLFGELVGSLLNPNFNHFSQAISDLVAVGSPFKGLLDSFFIGFSLMVILFAIGLATQEKSRQFKIGALSLAAVGFLALSMFMFFPLTPWPSSSAVMHRIITTTIAILGLLAIINIGLSIGSAKFRKYSVLTSVVALGGALATASTYMQFFYLFGVFEHITIIACLQWVAGLSLFMLGSAKEETHLSVASTSTMSQPTCADCS